jgi:hypothetical protein
MHELRTMPPDPINSSKPVDPGRSTISLFTHCFLLLRSILLRRFPFARALLILVLARRCPILQLRQPIYSHSHPQAWPGLAQDHGSRVRIGRLQGVDAWECTPVRHTLFQYMYITYSSINILSGFYHKTEKKY